MSFPSLKDQQPPLEYMYYPIDPKLNGSVFTIFE